MSPPPGPPPRPPLPAELGPDGDLDVLRASVDRLRTVVEPLAADDLDRVSYADEWTVAQVLSHLGSGAVIMGHHIDRALSGESADASFAPAVWDEWNAKPADQQAADALAADAALIDRFDTLTEDERARFQLSIGPFQLDLAGTIRMRLNEHAVHRWDIDVTSEPPARLDPDAVPVMIDNLDTIARFGAKPDGTHADIHIATTNPERHFRLELTGDTATLTATTPAGPEPDLVLPAEAFIRLVYGRLDPAHTPPEVTTMTDGTLTALRHVYHGI